MLCVGHGEGERPKQNISKTSLRIKQLICHGRRRIMCILHYLLGTINFVILHTSVPL